jgi:site-specific DNA-cytosine methylase
MCEVKAVVTGYPCKTISSQNNDPKSIRDESSASGRGLKALMNFVDSQELEFIITENVKTMFSRRRKFQSEVPIEEQNREMVTRSFHPTASLPDSKYFGVPHNRPRCWGIYLKERGQKHSEEAVRNSFFSFQLKPVPIEMVLTDKVVPAPKVQCGKSGYKWKDGFKEVCKEFGKDGLVFKLLQITSTSNS